MATNETPPKACVHEFEQSDMPRVESCKWCATVRTSRTWLQEKVQTISDCCKASCSPCPDEICEQDRVIYGFTCFVCDSCGKVCERIEHNALPTKSAGVKAQTVPELVRELLDAIVYPDEWYEDAERHNKYCCQQCLMQQLQGLFDSQEAEIARLRVENEQLRYPNDEPGLDLSKIPQMDTTDWFSPSSK